MDKLAGSTHEWGPVNRYEPPTLVELGTLQDLTQGGFGSNQDCAVLGTAAGGRDDGICS